jgi:hypothetical protein
MKYNENGNPEPDIGFFQMHPEEDRQPWWNDGDKVAGLVTTILLLTIVLLICIILVSVAVKLAF